MSDSETTTELIRQLNTSDPDELTATMIEIANRGNTPEFERVCRVFAEHERWASDDFIAAIVEAANGPVLVAARALRAAMAADRAWQMTSVSTEIDRALTALEEALGEP